VINGEEFKLVKYCDEPKDGLAVVESRGWGFTIPTVILQAVWKTLEQKEPFAVWEPWRLTRDPASAEDRDIQTRVLKALCLSVTRKGWFKQVPPATIAAQINEPRDVVMRTLVKLYHRGLVRWNKANGAFVFIDEDLK
jgi:hypothetical protein